MDAGLTGGLIGIGVMGCGVLTILCYEKATPWCKSIKRKISSYRQQRQPLLKVTNTNPLLVTRSKQFQMKQLLQKK